MPTVDKIIENKKSGRLITIKQETPLKKVYVVDILKRIGE